MNSQIESSSSLRFSWKNLSLTKKLYIVVGGMAILILTELFVIRFAMTQLSAARALVGAESLWSKAQKDAVYSLQQYGYTQNEKHFQEFLKYLSVPEGDHLARLELLKPRADEAIVAQGFLQGHVHPEDIPPVINLLRRFYWVHYLNRALQIWSEGDVLMAKLREEANRYHEAIRENKIKDSEPIFERVRELNRQLTSLEEDFSNSLGEGSRWLDNVLLMILSLAVLMIEGIGLMLAFQINRSITLRLSALDQVANAIGKGEFKRRVEVESLDEIGKVSVSVNQMGELLEESYLNLEKKVTERTAEAEAALKTRDEFLSIASHELKTPLTSISLYMQFIEREMKQLPPDPKTQKLQDMVQKSTVGFRRLTVLLDELMDLTRIKAGKLEVHLTEGGPIDLIKEVVARFDSEARNRGIKLTFSSQGVELHRFDPVRLDQIATNLISNAIKYGGGSPIRVSLHSDATGFTLIVKDQGPGIPEDMKARLFKRFERHESDPHVSGLGLGLYITQQLVMAHGGEITVESSPGQGAEFKVRISG